MRGRLPRRHCADQTATSCPASPPLTSPRPDYTPDRHSRGGPPGIRNRWAIARRDRQRRAQAGIGSPPVWRGAKVLLRNHADAANRPRPVLSGGAARGRELPWGAKSQRVGFLRRQPHAFSVEDLLAVRARRAAGRRAGKDHHRSWHQPAPLNRMPRASAPLADVTTRSRLARSRREMAAAGTLATRRARRPSRWHLTPGKPAPGWFAAAAWRRSLYVLRHRPLTAFASTQRPGKGGGQKSPLSSLSSARRSGQNDPERRRQVARLSQPAPVRALGRARTPPDRRFVLRSAPRPSRGG